MPHTLTPDQAPKAIRGHRATLAHRVPKAIRAHRAPEARGRKGHRASRVPLGRAPKEHKVLRAVLEHPGRRALRVPLEPGRRALKVAWVLLASKALKVIQELRGLLGLALKAPKETPAHRELLVQGPKAPKATQELRETPEFRAPLVRDRKGHRVQGERRAMMVPKVIQELKAPRDLLVWVLKAHKATPGRKAAVVLREVLAHKATQGRKVLRGIKDSLAHKATLERRGHKETLERRAQPDRKAHRATKV